MLYKFLHVFAVVALFLFNAQDGACQVDEDRSVNYEIEAGLLRSKSLSIRGYGQRDATEGWQSQGAAGRFEVWSKRKEGWNFGVVFQPLYATFSDSLKSDLTFKGKSYLNGEHADATYQFHTIRMSANNLIFGSENSAYFRLGSSLIARWYRLDLETKSGRLEDKHFLAIPIINYDALIPINTEYDLVSRGDFLPSPSGGVFLDGLFDLLIAARRRLENRSSFDLGIRLAFAGYDPKEPDNYGSRFFFYSLVGRYTM